MRVPAPAPAPTTAPARPRTLLVGFAGQQGREYLPVLRTCADIAGGVDSAPGAGDIARTLGFPHFGSVAEAVARVRFDTAVVTVPHHAHFAVCEELLRHGKHVIKEKPFAVTEAQAHRLAALARRSDRSVYTLLQRNFDPVFGFARRHLERLGEPYWFSYDYHLNLPRPTSGWRARPDTALGGVLLDMGYHLIDVLAGMFPPPARVDAVFTYRYPEMRDYRLEDLVSLLYGYSAPSLAGSLRISRHHYEKTERLSVLGTRGTLTLEPGEATLTPARSAGPLRFVRRGTKGDTVRTMLASYLRRLEDRAFREAHLARQLATVRTIDGVYRHR
ncbi:Gfo/Idh/MocA family protein [Streptomyces harbinensis]